MRGLMIATLLLAGCPEHGSRGQVETARFVPLLCTGGNPGEPSCPINNVDLSNFGVAGARFLLAARPMSSGLQITGLMNATGRQGIAVDGLQLVLFENGVEVQHLELAAHYAVTPEWPILPQPNIDVIVPTTTTQMSLRADA